MSLLRRSRRRSVAIQLLLGLLLLRAAIPAGFMPQDGNPLRIQLCSVGLPADLAPPMPHGGHGEDCPFGHAPMAGPLGDVSVPRPAATAPLALPAAFASIVTGLRLSQAHRARAPPVTA